MTTCPIPCRLPPGLWVQISLFIRHRSGQIGAAHLTPGDRALTSAPRTSLHLQPRTAGGPRTCLGRSSPRLLGTSDRFCGRQFFHSEFIFVDGQLYKCASVSPPRSGTPPRAACVCVCVCVRTRACTCFTWMHTSGLDQKGNFLQSPPPLCLQTAHLSVHGGLTHKRKYFQ